MFASSNLKGERMRRAREQSIEMDIDVKVFFENSFHTFGDPQRLVVCEEGIEDMASLKDSDWKRWGLCW